MKNLERGILMGISGLNPKNFRIRFVQGCSLITAGFGLLSISGWASGHTLLGSFGSENISMSPSTALLFILFGTALFIIAGRPAKQAFRKYAVIIVLAGTVMAILLLILSFLKIRLQAETLGSNITGKIHGAVLGHISPLSAGGFIIAGISFLLSFIPFPSRPWRPIAALFFAVVILLTGMFCTEAYLLSEHFLYGSSVALTALPSSLAFIVYGAGLLFYSENKVREDVFSRNGADSNIPLALIIFTLIFSACILSASYFYFHNYKYKYRAAIVEQLAAVADQKKSEIVQWRKERLGDAYVYYKNKNFSGLVKRALFNMEDADARERLKIWLEKVQTSYNYDRVFILDAKGNGLASSPESQDPIEPHLVKDVATVLASGRVTFLDFHRDLPDNSIHMSALVPIFDEENGNAPLGVLVLKINPEKYLYPLIRQWPIASKTAETLLVRREGDEVVFLNELRFKKDSALNLRFPVAARADLPAVQAVLGKPGIVEGRDYRGVQVIAYVRSIPDSPWFIVARMDIDEVFAPVTRQVWMLVLLNAMLLAVAGISVGLTWRQQRLEIFKERYKTLEAVSAGEVRYREMLDNMMEGCQIIGFDWKYLYLNDAAVEQSKQTKERLIGHTLTEAYPGIENTKMFADLCYCMSERTKKIIENEFSYSDGEKRYFTLSIQPVPEGIFILSIDITKRKKAEDALLLAHQRMGRFVEANIIGVVIAAPNGKIIEANDYYLNMIGFTRKEFESGKVDWRKITPPEWLPADDRAIHELRERGTCTPYEKEYVKRDGSRVTIFLADAMLPGPEEHIAAFVLDITQLKRSEERERHLNALLRAIRGINQLITKERNSKNLVRQSCYLLTSTGAIKSAWILLLDQYGKTQTFAESGLGDPSAPIKSMFENGSLPKCVRMALAGPEIVTMKNFNCECDQCQISCISKENLTYCLRLEQNRNIYGVITLSVQPAFGEDPQEVELYREIAGDISFALYNIELEEERLKIEKDLTDSETRYRTIFESAAEGIFVTKIATKKLLYANPAFCRMLGYSEDEIEQLKIEDIHTSEVMKRIEREFIEKYQIGETLKHQDIAFLKKDGTVFSADVITTPRISIDGVALSATFITDITEKKKVDEDKKKLQEQLWQAQKMEAVGRLSGGIAHDFNNMLTTIIGNSEIALLMMNKAHNGEEIKELIEDIRQAGGKAAVLTRQLLAFSRKQILKPEILSLNRIIVETEKMLRRLIGEDIKLETILAPDPGTVEADPGQIEQIIMNLAINARDAMPEGGILTIGTGSVELDEAYASSHFPQMPGKYEMISISDTGVGMSKEVREHIFEPFFTTKPMGKGTGLGLSIVYGIVKQSNGYIWVYSEPGKGTSFKIYLPRIEAAVAGQETPIKKPIKTVSGSETILVVEDEPMIMKTINKVLSKCGYTIMCAVDGNEALRIFEEHKDSIHLVLTDVILPGIGGRELVKRISGIRKDIKVIYMSGYTDNAIVHNGVLEKGINFLEKPFTSDNLMRKIGEALG
jgi:two-component system, cell cycle sensor histidine kinase and response regulator CckA